MSVLDRHHIGHAARGAQVQLAEGFARLVQNTPTARLERLMNSPVGRLLVETIFWQMPRFIDSERARDLRCAIDWAITRADDRGADVYRLQFAPGPARIIRGGDGREAQLTITVDAARFLLLATGNLDPMRAYFGGELVLAGDIMLAAKLVSLFRIPGHAPGPAAQKGR